MFLYQARSLVDAFDNTWACRREQRGAHKCIEPNPQSNCAIFRWAADGAPAAGPPTGGNGSPFCSGEELGVA